MTEVKSHASNDKKIEILLAEYQSLRTEVLQRNSVLNAAIASFGTLAVPIMALAYTQSKLIGLTLLIAVPITVFATWALVHQNTRALAVRLRELETQINEKAGERLLCWESSRVGMYSNQHHPN